jgi:DNA-binding transcriptional LysR family regulator
VRLFELHGKRLVPTAAALALLQATDEVSAALTRCEQTLGAYRETIRPAEA